MNKKVRELIHYPILSSVLTGSVVAAFHLLGVHEIHEPLDNIAALFIVILIVLYIVDQILHDALKI